LIKNLRIESKQEVEDRDKCVSDFAAIDQDMTLKSMDRKKRLAEVESLTAELEKLVSDIGDLNAENAKMASSAAEATEDRKAEHEEYLVVKKDHDETQAILQTAIDRMNQKYSDRVVVKNEEFGTDAPTEAPAEEFLQGADVVEVSATSDTPGSAPAAFTNSGATSNNSGGNKVVEMLTTIQADSAKAEADVTQSEKDSQANYDDFMNETRKATEHNNEAIANKTKRQGLAAKSKSENEVAAKSLGTAIFDLTEQEQDTHDRCDFLTKNFDTRQSNRVAEVEAAQKAKQILSGMA